MEETARSLVTKVKKTPKATKDSDAFLGLDKTVKEFLKTCPLVGALRHDGMRERHWEELMSITETSFSIPTNDKNMRLREILALNLHNFANEVEEITDKVSEVTYFFHTRLCQQFSTRFICNSPRFILLGAGG